MVWHLDSLRSGTEGHTGGSGGVILGESSGIDPMNLTFEQIDALLSLIEFHDDWDEVSELMGTDIELLHEILSEERDAVAVWEVAQGDSQGSPPTPYNYRVNQRHPPWTTTSIRRSLSATRNICIWTTAWQSVMISVLVLPLFLVMMLIEHGTMNRRNLTFVMMCDFWEISKNKKSKKLKKSKNLDFLFFYFIKTWQKLNFNIK